MNMKKCLLLVLTLCLTLSLLTIGVAAAEETGVFGTSMSTGTFVSLCIAAGLILVAVIICIIKHEKLAEALRAYRSEMKKITWYSWKNVVRGTIFVLVTVVAIAAVVGLLDLVFFEVQSILIK